MAARKLVRFPMTVGAANLLRFDLVVEHGPGSPFWKLQWRRRLFDRRTIRKEGKRASRLPDLVWEPFGWFSASRPAKSC